MATRVNTPLAGEIWHLSIEDLFAPVEEPQRLGGDGPFVINLSVSTAPINLPKMPFDCCREAHIYQIQVSEDGRMRYRLRLGPFVFEDDADAVLQEVREIYPAALTATACGLDLRNIESMEEKAESRRAHARKPTKAAAERAAAERAAAERAAAERAAAERAARRLAAERAAAERAAQILAAEKAAAERAAAERVAAERAAQRLAAERAAAERAAQRAAEKAAAERAAAERAARKLAEERAAAERAAQKLAAEKLAAENAAAERAAAERAAAERAARRLAEERAAAERLAAEKAAAERAARRLAEERAAAEKLAAEKAAAERAAAERAAQKLAAERASAERAAAEKLAAENAAAERAAQKLAAQRLAAEVSIDIGLPSMAASKPAPVLTDVVARILHTPAAVLGAASAREKIDAPVLTEVVKPARKGRAAKAAAPAAAALSFGTRVIIVPAPKASDQKAATPMLPAPAWAASADPVITHSFASKSSAMQAAMPPTIVATAAVPAPREVKQLSNPLPDLESTQTVRALTPPELEDQGSSRWFVIQLALADHAFDPEAVPNLDIFGEYRLYSVAGIDQGRTVHALRLGFFTEEIAAVMVASYLGAYYDKPTIRRVSVAERERFAHQRVEARKDVGATGTHAIIEITDELVARRKRAAPGDTSSLNISQSGIFPLR